MNDISKNPPQNKSVIEEGGLRFWPLEEKGPYYQEVQKLYHDSFPDSERKPFQMILEGTENGKMESYVIEDQSLQQLAGLAFVILGDPFNVLDYLAVTPEQRSQGTGARILTFLRKRSSRPFVVEIESTWSGDDEMANRRKQFYLRNGMQEGDFEFTLFDVPMEMLISEGIPDFDAYYQVMSRYFEFDPSRYIRLIHPSQKESEKRESV